MIRPTETKDLPRVMEIYSIAKAFMRSTGNMNQWTDGYPSIELIQQDMEQGNSYVVEIDEKVQCVFTMLKEDDPTYGYIKGKWLTDLAYLTVHRIASSGEIKGMGNTVFEWAKGYGKERGYGAIRVDTHKDNLPMQNTVTKAGFVYCGIIYLANGDERLAYEQKI